MPTRTFLIPWPSDHPHWVQDLLDHGIHRFEGGDVDRVVLAFDSHTAAAKASLALPHGTEAVRVDPHVALVLPEGADADELIEWLRLADHEFVAFSLVLVDAEPSDLDCIETVLAARI